MKELTVVSLLVGSFCACVTSKEGDVDRDASTGPDIVGVDASASDSGTGATDADAASTIADADAATSPDDTRNDATGDTGGDTVIAPASVCADPSATFTCNDAERFGAGLCKPPAQCSAIAECPTGYRCEESGGPRRCVCEDLAVCGLLCDAGQCPCGLSCGQGDRCVDAPPCAFPEHCGANERCERNVCEPLGVQGNRGDGAECNEGRECRNGACVNQTCTTLCDANADCTGGLVCAMGMMNFDALPGCVLPTVSQCEDEPCIGSAQVCLDRGECFDLCVTNDECTGRCLGDIERDESRGSSLLWRHCDATPTVCAASEVELVDRDGAVHCSVSAGCAMDAQCDFAYPRCLTVRNGVGLCARTPAL